MSDIDSPAGAGPLNDPMTLESDTENMDRRRTPTPKPKIETGVSDRVVHTPQKRETTAVDTSDEDGQKGDTLATRNAATDTKGLRKYIEVGGEHHFDYFELSEEEPEPSEADRAILQKERRVEETFERHPDIPNNKIIATFRMQKPDGSGEYVQRDFIPELNLDARPSVPPTSYFSPSLDSAKCPRKIRQKKGESAVLWSEDTVNDRWTRHKVVNGVTTLQRFRPTIVFRRFDAKTHEYLGAYVGDKKLENVDPNSKAWMYSYNKWIDQIKRRRDSAYVKAVHRDHWTGSEVRALYTAINDFCRTKGVDAFGCGHGGRMSNDDLQAMADAVNAADGKNRNIDAVRGKINTAHAEKNKAIAELRDAASQMRLWIEQGGEVSQEEQKPEYAIALSEYSTTDSTPDKKTKRKKKGLVSIKEESTSDSDLSSAPASRDSSPNEGKKGKNTGQKRKRTTEPIKNEKEQSKEIELPDYQSDQEEAVRAISDSNDASIQHHHDSDSMKPTESEKHSSDAIVLPDAKSAEEEAIRAIPDSNSASTPSPSPSQKRKRTPDDDDATSAANSSDPQAQNLSDNVNIEEPTSSPPNKKARFGNSTLNKMQSILEAGAE